MSDLIDHVASLLDLRDRDDLEFTLACVMFELLEAGALMVWRTAETEPPTFELKTRLVLEAACAPSVQEGDCVDIDELGAAARAAFLSRKPAEDGSRNAFPVTRGGDVIGLLELAMVDPLSAQQYKLIRGLIRIYRSHLGILDHNDIDELTGLDNRRPFNEAFHRLASGREPSRRDHSRRPRAELAVVDVDHFKRVNDTFGHVYGDEVLVLLARLMKTSFRAKDRVFRFGGEEFVVLLADVEPQAAEAALERLRKMVEAFPFPQVGRVTVSLGLTTIREGETGADAFGRADQALYKAKTGGRNQMRRYERLVEEGALTPKAKPLESVELF